ncbi:hypothetical protein ACQ4PT_014849 [Festuca glaucescens]
MEGEQWPADRVRQTFIDFFTSKSHARWPSSPVVPVDDPTLLFANAGMNQFKPVFLGAAAPDSPLGRLRRACNTQKCIRAGGKHNDLDDVGNDTYHHTFFEMLGSWSFGDYFKEEAIAYAWELLTEFNRESDGTLRPLPAKHVDTGMGFEHLTSILQNKMSNYDTDVFIPLFEAIHKSVGDGIEPYSGKLGCSDVGKVDTAYRVVADHIRTLSFAIADGSQPGNEGREYVLRRILRRAVHFDRQKLKAKQGFFSNLVDVFVGMMGDVFPELKENEKKIKDIIKDEEASFEKTLVKDAFVLWDTYGYPIDLTEVMAVEEGLAVDMESFNVCMEEARQKARDARTSVVMAIYTGSEFIASASGDEDFGLVLKRTSFYAEQGGQIYDTGSIEGSSGSFAVKNVQVFAGYVLHIGSFVEGSESKTLSVGDEVKCKVDYARRSLIAPNHTCTHMLNFALREVLGDHIDQKGSIVLPEKLRFDFSHGKPVKLEDLERIELKVNQQIKDELEVYAQEIKLADAKRINGLRAVFGEIYPDPVRVVAIGRKVEDLLADPESKEGLSISTELCGGTHISNTRVALAFAIISEEGIAKGVRRITAVTGECASQAMKLASSIDADIIDTSKLHGVELEKKIGFIKSTLDAAAIPATRKADLRKKVSELEDQMRKVKKKTGQENIQKAVKAAMDAADAALSAGQPFCIAHVDVGLNAAALREAVFKCMNRVPTMLFSTDMASNKVVVYAGVPPEALPSGLKVLEWLMASIGPLKGRGGGGKNGLAQGQVSHHSISVSGQSLVIIIA